ncbi:hypothetical protein AB0F96_19500 [Streptomyces sp. NPDC023998]|uniref:hypothetical protein n=1 Tax=Streptomyces sp. NPDC023998 TaxID=3154597 RepID=UPI0033C092C0
MKLFDDPLSQKHAERALELINRGVAEYGDRALTAWQIAPVDRDARHRAWPPTAVRMVAAATRSLFDQQVLDGLDTAFAAVTARK